jgi:hypothetical protein
MSDRRLVVALAQQQQRQPLARGGYLGHLLPRGAGLLLHAGALIRFGEFQPPVPVLRVKFHHPFQQRQGSRNWFKPSSARACKYGPAASSGFASPRPRAALRLLETARLHQRLPQVHLRLEQPGLQRAPSGSPQSPLRHSPPAIAIRPG